MSDFDKIIEQLENKNNEEITKEFPQMVKEINQLILNIYSSNTISDATRYFDSLQHINDVVTTIIYVKKIKVPDQLFKFFKDFDRIDDLRVREYMFKDIKSGEYTIFS